jgi:hypothetical protein
VVRSKSVGPPYRNPQPLQRGAHFSVCASRKAFISKTRCHGGKGPPGPGQNHTPRPSPTTFSLTTTRPTPLSISSQITPAVFLAAPRIQRGKILAAGLLHSPRAPPAVSAPPSLALPADPGSDCADSCRRRSGFPPACLLRRGLGSGLSEPPVVS